MPDHLASLDALLGLGRGAADLTFVQIVCAVSSSLWRRCSWCVAATAASSQKTAFDAVLGFILASMLARAVNGTAAFLPTLGGGLVLVLLHRLLAYWSRRSHAVGLLIKGRSDVIVKDGVLDEGAARRNRVSERDVLEDLRLNGNVPAIADAALAVLERNGQISVVRR